MDKELVLNIIDNVLKNKSEVISENIAIQMTEKLSDYEVSFSELNTILYSTVYEELNSTMRDYIHKALK